MDRAPPAVPATSRVRRQFRRRGGEGGVVLVAGKRLAVFSIRENKGGSVFAQEALSSTRTGRSICCSTFFLWTASCTFGRRGRRRKARQRERRMARSRSA